MTQPAATLPELISQLGRTFSPFERLKILGRAWVLLRSMTPQERLIVAGQLGLDRADEVVEAIARHSGTQASPVLLALIDEAQKKGTVHLPELLSDLKDPDKRGERLRQGATTGEGALAAKGSPAPWLPASMATPERPKPAAPKPIPTPAPAPVADSPQAAPKPAPPLAPAPAPALVLLPSPDPPALAPPQPAAPVVDPPAPEPEAPERLRRSSPPPKPQLEPTPAGEIAAPLHLMDRFRQLRRTAEEAQRLPASGLRSLAEEFPDGWARRRALMDLLRAGNPPDIGDALALLDILGAERDRLWCLGVLADSREMAAADREALLAAAPSPTARRSLERRLGEL